MPADIEKVRIDLGDRGYDILIGTDILSDPESYRSLPSEGMAVVVTDANVEPLYGTSLRQALQRVFPEVRLLVLPAGETHKAWPALMTIFDALLKWGCDRKTTLFALGGGVVGDMTGFVAACYMRGIAYVQVPTTLLAQVDSSVGGKTAINHPLGKNMIGAFHQPLRVIADVSTLETLPHRELVAGFAEVVKYGPISDEPFLTWIEAHAEALAARDKTALSQAIKRSCEIKAAIVGRDEREAGERAILNFGHTFGHAIEVGVGYGTWLHGEAVACGMVMAARLSVELGLIGVDDAERLRRIIDRMGLPVIGPPVPVERYLELMRVDKKAESGQLRFVLLEELGRATIRSAPTDSVRRAIEQTA